MEWIQSKIVVKRDAQEVVGGILIEANVGGYQVEDDLELYEFLNSKEKNWDYVDEDLENRSEQEISDYVTMTFYVSKNPAGNELLLLVQNGLNSLDSNVVGLDVDNLKVVTEYVDDEAWLNEWKKYYKPFRLGNSVIVKPVWEEYDKADTDVIFNIEPGHVFGTGLHQSTQLCVVMLEKYMKKGYEVLDLGCGSGILSIISLLLGASSAFAVDIDDNARAVAYDNAKLNGITEETYTVQTGNVMSDEMLIENISVKKYDIVLANIVADVIINISELVSNVIKDGGIFITSGIIEERLDEVRNKIEEVGLTILEVEFKDGWCCIVASK